MGTIMGGYIGTTIGIHSPIPYSTKPTKHQRPTAEEPLRLPPAREALPCGGQGSAGPMPPPGRRFGAESKSFFGVYVCMYVCM